MFAHSAFGPNSWRCGAFDTVKRMLTLQGSLSSAGALRSRYVDPNIALAESGQHATLAPTCRMKSFVQLRMRSANRDIACRSTSPQRSPVTTRPRTKRRVLRVRDARSTRDQCGVFPDLSDVPLTHPLSTGPSSPSHSASLGSALQKQHPARGLRSPYPSLNHMIAPQHFTA